MRNLIAALGMLVLGGCSVYSPDAGHEVVLVEKPLLLGHGGVDDEPVKTGRTFAAITTQGVDVYMQPQRFEAPCHANMLNLFFPGAVLDCSRRVRDADDQRLTIR